MTALEVVAVAITLVAVYLTTRQVVWCWPLGMLSAALYGVVFYEARLYAEVGLQVVYVVLSAYGWWAWLRRAGGEGELRVSRTPSGLRWGLLGLGAIAGATLGGLLHRFTGASLPYIDSTLAAFSIVAQWMQTRKLLEAWGVWIAVDVIYVGMFAYKALHLTAALYALFLYLAARGHIEWRRSLVGGAEAAA
jgi:nicotinamide mononucleotide transporter